MDISPVPSERDTRVPVSLTLSTGTDRYSEVATLAMELPRLPVMPSHLTGWSGVAHLFVLYKQAVKWVDIGDEVRKKAEWVWKKSVIEKGQQYLAVVDELHKLRDDGSSFCPLLWCWWKTSMQKEEGYSGLNFADIWHPAAVKSKKMRRWFYEEANTEFISRRKLWPDGASALFDLLREFEQLALDLDSEKSRANLWADKFAFRYATLLGTGHHLREAAAARLAAMAAKFDLGVWLSNDLTKYAGLVQVQEKFSARGPSAARARSKNR